MTNPTPPRRTKRRHAHEVYPHPGEWETRPLEVDVPYLYARAIGLGVFDTGWYDQLDPKNPEIERREAASRINEMVAAQRLAFLADALLQGKGGEEAWKYAHSFWDDVAAEHAWERAQIYGVDPEAIKPYPCGPEPAHHNHYTDMETRSGTVTRIPIPESECAECTEWVCTCTPEQVDLECAFHNDPQTPEPEDNA